MKLPQGKKLVRIVSAAVLTVSSLASIGFSETAHAAALTNVEIVFDNMQTSATTAGTVCAKPASTATEGKVDVTFPTGFTIDTTTADWTVNATSNGAWPAGATPWITPAAPTGTITPQDVVFGSGDLTAGTLYCFNWTSTTITQPSSANPNEVGTVTTQTSGGSAIDSSQFATATLSNDTVNVTATVPPLFSFSVGPNSDALGTVTTSSVVKSSGTKPVLTVSTNATGGWQIWAKDSNTGLKSTQNGYTIASHTGTITTGQEFYNTGVFSQAQAGGSGTVTLGTGWDDSSNNGTGVGLTTSFQTVATSNGTADTSAITLVNSVAVKATTPAASDYADTQTYIGAGLF